MQAGVPVARGCVVHTLAEALALIEETGYPVVAKPDTGVGAAATYRISSRSELEAFFANKPPVEYIMEEYIDGQIVSFDGLTDKDGQIVFYTAHAYSTAVMDILLKDDHIYYHSYRQVPPDLEDAGRRTVQAFDVRERFFHIEFFRLFDSGKIVALEVNMRPPGGLTTDMFNYANDIDIYAGFANLIVNGAFNQPSARPYICCYIGRKSHVSYTHSHADIINTLKDRLVHYEAMSGVFAPLLGSYGYLVRSPEMEDIQAMAAYIQAHA
jgi:biotin carboxylase